MTTIALTLDRVNMADTVKLTAAIQTIGNIFDPNAVAVEVDGSPVTRQQALDAAARLAHEDIRPRLSGHHGAYQNGMRDLIFELFGADALNGDAGRTYVDQELDIRLRRLAS